MRTPSQKQERRIGQVYGGTPTAASGAFWSRKGDVRCDDLLLEAKITGKLSYSVKGAVWEKIRREALLDSRLPVLAVELGTGHRLVVLAEEDFLALRAQADTAAALDGASEVSDDVSARQLVSRQKR